MRVAVLDLGSTSFQLVVADVDADSITVLARDREMLRLGASVAASGAIPADVVAAAVEVVDRFRRGAALAGAEVTSAVATAALRDAANGQELVGALADAAGAPIRLLDGETEARLALVGMRAGVPGMQEPVLGIDLGGGSLDLAVSTRTGKPAPAASLPLGAQRLLNELSAEAPLTRACRRAVAERVRDELASIERVARANWTTCVVTGGALGAIARVILAERGGWTPATPNGARLSAAEVAWVADTLGALTVEERMSFPGMESRRADVVPIAAAVLVEIARALDLETLLASEWGLREGVLLETCGATAPPVLERVRDATVDRLVADWNADDGHGRHVANLALGLFDQLRRAHRLRPADRALLAYGARLHDLGARVANGGHHKHGAYLVEHANLRGFLPEEAAMLASLIRFHKGSGLKSSYEPYATLPTEAQQSVERMTALLQIADGLDRGHEQCVAGTQIRRVAGGVSISVDGPGDVELACWAAQQKSELLASVLRLPVTLRATGSRVAATAGS